MERAKLIVKNFGPLKNIDIEVREMVTFIGAQTSGKSTLAKLISILEDENFRRDSKITFEEELTKYNMKSFYNDETIISYCKGDYNFTFKNRQYSKTNPRELIKEQFVDFSKKVILIKKKRMKNSKIY
jgi:predicted ATPase